MFDRVIDDLRQGARILTKAPGLSATAALLIALVVGGNATVYSMVNSVVRRPAPGVTAPDLVAFAVAGRPGAPYIPYGDYLTYAMQSTSLRSLAAWDFSRAGVTTAGGTYLLQVTPVTQNYFATIGIVPAIGRDFTPDDDRPGAPLVAIISDAVWKTHYERDTSIVGRQIEIGGRPATIVGVTPAPFAGPNSGEWTDVWVPLQAHHQPAPYQGLILIGRLAPGASVERVRTEIAALEPRLAPLPPDRKRGPVLVTPYAASAGGFIPAFERQILAVFSIITLLTLAVVGANVANLMLARAVARQRETAVRQSLGASRGRLVRLVLGEGFAIAILSCVFALVLAWWAASLIPRSLPVNRGTMPLEFTPDWRVGLYAFVLTLAGTMMASLAPSLRTWRQNLLPSLKDGGHTAAPGGSRLSSSLVVVQLAFSVLLLTVGVLTYRSWTSMTGDRLGFDTNGILLVNVGTSDAAATPAEKLVLLDRIRQEINAIPNVSFVSYTREWFNSRSHREIRTLDSTEPLRATVSTVGQEYLKTLGITTIAGRDLTESDRLRTGGAALINRTLAATLFPARNPVGETLLVDAGKRPVEIVGVVPDVFYRGFDLDRPNPDRADQPPNYVFVADQAGSATRDVAFAPVTFYVRYSGTLAAVSDAVPLALRGVDPRVALWTRETMNDRLEQQAVSARLISTLLAIFAGISLLIAAIGQYAAVSFETRRHTRDFGVRLALGASGRQIIGAVLGTGAMLTGAGLAGGFLFSLAVAAVLQNQFFGVRPTDPTTYLVVFVLLACVSLVACYLPARRASRIDPVQALRQE